MSWSGDPGSEPRAGVSEKGRYRLTQKFDELQIGKDCNLLRGIPRFDAKTFRDGCLQRIGSRRFRSVVIV